MKNWMILFGACLLLVQTGYSQNKKPLLVASYNIRYDNPNDGVNSWSNRKEEVKALISFYDFDIFGTQEGLIGQLQDIAGLEQYAFTGNGRDDGQQAGEHSAIFYKKARFKLLGAGNFWLSETPDVPSMGWDAVCCKRICSWGKFEDLSSGKKFYFFSVHFDHQGVEARRQSGKLMVRKITEIAKGLPVICVGDFNSTPETEQIAAMQTILDDACKVSEHPPYGPVGTTNSFKFDAPMKSRIDYIFVSKQITVQKYGVLTDSYDRKYPSDHQPVVAKMVIH